MIENLSGLLGFFGAENTGELPGRVRKETGCGAVIELLLDNGAWVGEESGIDEVAAEKVVGFKLLTIVEGSDAEIETDEIEFPVGEAEMREALEWLEGEAERAWSEAKEDDAGYYEDTHQE